MISLPCKILSLRRNRTIQIRPSFETNQTAVDSKDLSHCKKGHLQEDRKKNSTPKRVLKTQATHRPKSKFHMRKLNHTFSFKPVAHRGAPQGYSTSLAPWKSSIYVQITLLFKRWVCKFITLVTPISFGIFLQFISLRSHSSHHWNKHLLAEFLHNKTDKSNNKKINITPLAKQ